ncbi:MAG: sigma-54-dependent transcriptional regulator [Pseudomonadota bacterium]
MSYKYAQLAVIEDDPALNELLVEELEAEGFKVDHYDCVEAFQQQQKVYDLLISDIRLPGVSGLSLLEWIKQQQQPPALLLITAFGTVDQAVDALKQGAADFLTKPLDIEHLLLSVQRILEHRTVKQELARFKSHQTGPGGIIGQSPAMRKLYDQIEQIAAVDGSVLILGESGTGKELVAKAIHQYSPRAEKPFQAVNCAGIPSELMESEFFGHEAGSFSGAKGKRQGLLKQTDGGTLLLDEIGEMPISLQAKLLRVLQEGTIRAVGSDKEETVDVRILAATHQNLEQKVIDGSFRQDLFYRLETFSISVPPLRDRGEDIERLVWHFIAMLQQHSGKQVKDISSEALDALFSYPFPGNVRELQNAIERAAAFSNNGMINREDLPARIVDYDKADATEDPLTWPTLQQLQQDYVDQVMQHVEGNKSKAAELLGITRRTLYRWLDDNGDQRDSE